jgi:hypothetical protein
MLERSSVTDNDYVTFEVWRIEWRTRFELLNGAARGPQFARNLK